MNPQAIEDPKGGLSQKFFDFSHSRCLIRRRSPGIEANQAKFPSWTPRLRLVCRKHETISSHAEYPRTAPCLLNQGRPRNGEERHVTLDNNRPCCLARAGTVLIRRARPSRRRAHGRWARRRCAHGRRALEWRPLEWWRSLERPQSLRVSWCAVPPPRPVLRWLCGLRLRMLALAADPMGLASRMGMRVSLLWVFLKHSLWQ